MDGLSKGTGTCLAALAWLLLSVSPAWANDAGQLVINARGAPKGMDFVSEVREALAYVSVDPLLDDVLSHGTRIEIRHTDGMTRVVFHVNDGSAVVLFNPRLGIRVDNDKILSPALYLAHELGHVHRGLRGTIGTRNGRFTTAEEIAVIREIEQRVARSLGEPLRDTWAGTPVTVGSVTVGRYAGPAQPISASAFR